MVNTNAPIAPDLAQVASSSQDFTPLPVRDIPHHLVFKIFNPNISHEEKSDIIAIKPDKKFHNPVIYKSIKTIMTSIAYHDVIKTEHPPWIRKIIERSHPNFYLEKVDETIDEICTKLLKKFDQGELITTDMFHPSRSDGKNALHLACMWNNANWLTLINLLICCDSRLLEEADCYLKLPFDYVNDKDKLFDLLHRYIFITNHPETPLEYLDDSIYHFRWLSMLCTCREKELAIQYAIHRPWSIIPIDENFKKEYLLLHDVPQPLHTAYVNHGMELVFTLVDGWDNKLLPIALVNSDALLCLHQLPHISFDKLTIANICRSTELPKWIQSHPILKLNNLNHVSFYFNINRYIITSINSIMYYDAGIQANGQPVLKPRNYFDFVYSFELLTHTPLYRKKVISQLTNLFSNTNINIVTYFLSNVNEIIKIFHEIPHFINYPEYVEEIFNFLLDSYIKYFPETTLETVVPLIKYIRNPHKIKECLYKFKKGNSINLLYLLVCELTSPVSSKGKDVFSNNHLIDENILQYCQELDLLNAPIDIFSMQNAHLFENKLPLNAKKSKSLYCDIISELFYSQHPKSYDYLIWIIQNINWIFIADRLYFLYGSECTVQDHFFYQTGHIPLPTDYEKKICAILPYLKNLNISQIEKDNNEFSYRRMTENQQLISYQRCFNHPPVFCKILNFHLGEDTLNQIRDNYSPYLDKSMFLKHLNSFCSLEYFRNGAYIFNLPFNEIINSINFNQLVSELSSFNFSKINRIITFMQFLQHIDESAKIKIDSLKPFSEIITWQAHMPSQHKYKNATINRLLKIGFSVTLDELIMLGEKSDYTYISSVFQHVLEDKQFILFENEFTDDTFMKIKRFSFQQKEISSRLLIDDTEYTISQIWKNHDELTPFEITDNENYTILKGFFLSDDGVRLALNKWVATEKQNHEIAKRWLEFAKWINLENDNIHPIPNLNLKNHPEILSNDRARSPFSIRIVSNEYVEIINEKSEYLNYHITGTYEEVFFKVSTIIKKAAKREEIIEKFLLFLYDELGIIITENEGCQPYHSVIFYSDEEKITFIPGHSHESRFYLDDLYFDIPDCQNNQLEKALQVFYRSILGIVKVHAYLESDFFNLDESFSFSNPIIEDSENAEELFCLIKTQMISQNESLGVSKNFEWIFYKSKQNEDFNLLNRIPAQLISYHKYMKEVLPLLDHGFYLLKETLNQAVLMEKKMIHHEEADIDVENVLLTKCEALYPLYPQKINAIKESIKKVYSENLLGWNPADAIGKLSYKMLKVRLSHICKKYLDDNDNNGFMLLIDSEIDNKDYCGTRRGESIWQQYQICFMDELIPATDFVQNPNRVLFQIISHAMLDLVAQLSMLFISDFALDQPSHTRNYIRKAMQKLNIPLPEDPDVPPELSTENADIFSVESNFEDISQEYLQIVIQETIKPHLIVYIFQKIENYENCLLHPESHTTNDVKEASHTLSGLIMLLKRQFQNASLNTQNQILGFISQLDPSIRSKLDILNEETASYFKEKDVANERLKKVRSEFELAQQDIKDLEELNDLAESQLDKDQQIKKNYESLIQLATSSDQIFKKFRHSTTMNQFNRLINRHKKIKSYKVKLKSNNVFKFIERANDSLQRIVQSHPHLIKINNLKKDVKYQELCYEKIIQGQLPLSLEMRWDEFLTELGLLKLVGKEDFEFHTLTPKSVVTLLFLNDLLALKQTGASSSQQ